MNTPVHTLLRALEALGIHSIGFRILSHGKCLRHTSPVALTIEATRANPPVSRFSISDLFAAYSLTPRKGEYVLNVEDGCLAYLPETVAKVAKPGAIRPAAFKASRKSSHRRRRHAFPGAPARLAA
jgi:hypothetical protein